MSDFQVLSNDDNTPACIGCGEPLDLIDIQTGEVLCQSCKELLQKEMDE